MRDGRHEKRKRDVEMWEDRVPKHVPKCVSVCRIVAMLCSKVTASTEAVLCRLYYSILYYSNVNKE